MTLVQRLVANVERSPDRVVVGIDGPDAAGKTTLADRLAAALPGPVVRICADDFLRSRADRYRRGSSCSGPSCETSGRCRSICGSRSRSRCGERWRGIWGCSAQRMRSSCDTELATCPARRSTEPRPTRRQLPMCSSTMRTRAHLSYFAGPTSTERERPRTGPVLGLWRSTVRQRASGGAPSAGRACRRRRRHPHVEDGVDAGRQHAPLDEPRGELVRAHVVVVPLCLDGRGVAGQGPASSAGNAPSDSRFSTIFVLVVTAELGRPAAAPDRAPRARCAHRRPAGTRRASAAP